MNTASGDINLMRVDRIGYAIVGGALLVSGLRRFGLIRLALGGTLLYQAYTGSNPIFRRMGLRVNQHPPEAGVKETLVVAESVTVGVPRDALYRYWRNFANLPRFMRHLVAVRVVNERRSHWMAQAPAGRIVEWDAEIVEEVPGELLRWRSLPDADVTNFGVVRFIDAPAGQATEVQVEIQYVPPGGSLGAAIARYTGEEPQWQLADDLRRLKQLAESGELRLELAQHATSSPA
ncbi:MAG: SRPBCC family protein [Rhodospirillaceae bacterium]